MDDTIMFVSTGTGVRILKEFVAEVLVVCANDVDGVTWGLEEKARQAGAELGMSQEEMDQIVQEA